MDFRNTIGIDGIRKYMNPISQYQMIDAFDKVDGKAILKAHDNLQRILRLFDSFFKDHGFLVCPTAQVVPFDKEMDYVHEINGQPMSDYLEWMSICCILSITGFPIISVPCGFTSDGLPLAIQIVGKPQADLEVLKFAHAFEQATNYSPKNRIYRPEI
jgi:amidase